MSIQKSFVFPVIVLIGLFSYSQSHATVPSSGLVGSWDGSVTASVSHSSALNPDSSLWTVAAWVKGTSDGTIVWKGGSNDLYELFVSGGNAGFTINAGGTSVTATAISSATVADGEWHLITGVRSGTKIVDVYVDGSVSGTATYSGSGAAIDTTSAMTIGSKNGSNDFSGDIGNIYVYNRSLSQSEIQQIHSDGSGTTEPPPPPPPPPVTDTTSPTISITSPSSGSTISNSISISGNASDNIGVVGVQFKIDGSNIGNEDTSSLYSLSWDSTSASNGAHTITAVARDAAGNTGTDSINVTIDNNIINPPPPPPPPPPPSCAYPSQILNLTDWKETLPTGASESPTEIKQPALATYTITPYFKVNDACNGVQFRAHTSGVTTSGSGYPRSELREMSNNGSTNASWATNDGKTHTMFIDQAIVAVPTTKKHVVAGQIHDAADDVIVIRLENSKLFVDINGVDGPTLDSNYTLGKRFTVKFVAGGGKIQVYYNGASTPAYTLTKNGSGNYFKAGVYTQSNCSTEAACSINNYGEVHIYDLWLSHTTGNPPPDNQTNYIITASAGAGGSISPSGSISVSSGSSKSFIITPNSGYRVNQVLVDGVAISTISAAGGTYNFSNVTSNKSISVSFQQIPITLDTTAPSIPTGLTATAVSSSQINLSWNASSDTSGISGYRLYRNGLLVNTFVSTSYQDTGLTANTSYSYTVSAVDASSNANFSAQSLSVNATTQGGVVSNKFTIGQQVIANAIVNARPTPGGSPPAQQPAGSIGSVISGPVNAVLPSSGNYFWWWNINFENGTDGWVGQDGLDLYIAPPPVTDTVSPLISLIAPTPNATVSGSSVTISALASDNIGVVGVRFKFDGNNLGSELSTAPYSGTWNTLGVSNGSHNLTAVARDAAGNTKTSSNVPVSVNNVAIDTTVPTVPTGLSASQPSNPTQTGGGRSTGRGASTGVFTPTLPQSPISNLATATAVSQGSVSGHVFNSYLSIGQTSSEVNLLQNFLISQGLLKIAKSTNYYGPMTVEAVKAFQRLNGIDQTGGVGPLTRAAINRKLGGLVSVPAAASTVATSLPVPSAGIGQITKPLSLGMTDPQVTILQQFLVVKGYLLVSPTGYYGQLTMAAVKKFQAANGIDQVGAVGPMTRAAINNSQR